MLLNAGSFKEMSTPPPFPIGSSETPISWHVDLLYPHLHSVVPPDSLHITAGQDVEVGVRNHEALWGIQEVITPQMLVLEETSWGNLSLEAQHVVLSICILRVKNSLRGGEIGVLWRNMITFSLHWHSDKFMLLFLLDITCLHC